MKIYILIFLAVILGTTSCDKSTNSDLQDADKKKLSELREEIQNMVDTVACVDPNDWSFSAIGHKACGGPQGYIAYPHVIDTALFTNLVADYTLAEKEYQIKYNLQSDCMAILPPDGIECIQGKPKFIYSKLN